MPRPRTGARAVLATVLATALAGSLALGTSPGTAAPPPVPGTPGGSGAGADGVPGPGTWQVTRTAADTFEVRWRAPRRLPLGSDRPTIVEDGAPIGVPVIAGDGRTVVTTVTTTTRPDPAELDVVLSGDRLDHAGSDQVGEGVARAARTPRTTALADDPAAPGPHDVVTSDYELDPVKLPRMREPIEMVGHVVEPAPSASTGPRPLVVFLHGRHSFCYDPTDPDGAGGWDWPCRAPYEDIPSHLGYDYIQRVLASQGYATVSVRVNGINAQDFAVADGGADARAAIVRRHLDHWTTLAGDRQVDLSRVVLVGHSRGGEGVNRASIQVPLDAPYRIVGQVLLAPTDFATQTAPYVPTVTVLPYCDGDVFDLQGQRFTDSARDLVADDTSLKSSVMVLGANHNYFNTEWTPGVAQAPANDDWYGRRGVCGSASPTRLDDARQRDVGLAYVAGATRLFAEDAEEFLPLFDGSAVRPASIGSSDVRSHAIGGGRELRRPALDSGLSLAEGAETAFCQGVVRAGSLGACGRQEGLFGQAPHWYEAGELAPSRRALEMSWTAAGASGGLELADPLDLTGDRLELRTVVDPTLGDVRLRVRLTDAAGGSAVLVPEGDGMLRALPLDRSVGKRWAQTLVTDPTAASGVDLTQVTRVDLLGDSDDGRVWVLDLAAAPATLAPVPARRLPLVSLGSVRVDEGDAPGTSVARLPFTVSGPVTRAAQLTVGVLQQTRRGSRERLRVDLAPGQTEGAIRYEYAADTLHEQGGRLAEFAAFAVRGAMTDRYLGRLVIRDDDPAPRMRVRVPRRVSEGDPVRLRMRLSAPMGADTWFSVRAVRGSGPGRRLSVGDVPREWLERRDPDAASLSPRTGLHQAHVYLYTRVPAGRRSATLTLPTRSDAAREGAERVTFRNNDGRGSWTVRVVDRRGS